MQLGLLGILTFVAVYISETEGQLRAAIAASIVMVFLLLIIDLLTIVDFRNELTDLADVSSSAGTDGGDPVMAATAEVATSFVEGLFGTFKWVVTTVVGFYFAAGAAEEITNKVQTAKTNRVEKQLGIAKLESNGA